MRAFIFPGQGAQIIGMGKDIANEYETARAVFEEVDSAYADFFISIDICYIFFRIR